MSEYLVVRVLRISLLKNEANSHVTLTFGACQTEQVNGLLAFKFFGHSRLFHPIQVDLWQREVGCLGATETLVARGALKVGDILEPTTVTIELSNIEASSLSLLELQPLPDYNPLKIAFGVVDLQIFTVPGESLDKSSISIISDSVDSVQDPNIMYALSSLHSTMSAFSGSILERGDYMARALTTLLEYYQRRPHLPEYKYMVEHEFRDSSRLKLAKDLFPFAIASIGWIGVLSVGQGYGLDDLFQSEFDLMSAVRFLHLQPSDVLKYEFSPKGLFKPSFVVFKSKQLEAFVVAMRCSIDVHDFLADALCDYSEFMNGYTHSGVLKCAQWVFEQTFELLRDNKEFDKVYITGHSLGAGISVILSILFEKHLRSFGKEIKCVALSPPPTVSSEMMNDYKNVIDIYIYDEDVVPRLSYGGAVDTQTLQRYCAYLHGTHPNMDQETLFRNIDECRKALREKSSALKLGHPGNVILTAIIDSKVKGIVCQNDNFQEVRLSKSMITHHFPNWYGWVIAAMNDQL